MSKDIKNIRNNISGWRCKCFIYVMCCVLFFSFLFLFLFFIFSGCGSTVRRWCKYTLQMCCH